MNDQTYTTKDDAIGQAIDPCLEVKGVCTADDFDVDAIFDECFAFDADRQVFIQTVDEGEFWASVERHTN